MADLARVRVWAHALISLHLDASWTFAFDNAKKRAGLCNYSTKRISVSRYLASRYDDDEIHQVLLHEVAHAMAGPKAGHSPAWVRVARDIGYEGQRLHHGKIADELAPWVGACPQGHRLYRYRAPTRRVSCGECSRRFDPTFEIVWTKRTITPAERAKAALNAS